MMLSVFYLSLFCGLLSLVFETLPQKRALGAFRTVCIFAAVSAVLFAPQGAPPLRIDTEDKTAYFETLSEETIAKMFREAERTLAADLSARIEGEFSAAPLVCTVDIDRKSASVRKVSVEFPAEARLVSGYEVKRFIYGLYGKTVKAEVTWRGEISSGTGG